MQLATGTNLYTFQSILKKEKQNKATCQLQPRDPPLHLVSASLDGVHKPIAQ